VLKIAFSILFGIYWGLAGIVLATAISKLLTYAWYEAKILFRDFLGGKATAYLFGHILNLIMLLACVALTYFVLPWNESAGWLQWILKGIFYTVCINAVYFLRFFKTSEFRFITDKAKGFLRGERL